jgi:hypothetical protein
VVIIGPESLLNSPSHISLPSISQSPKQSHLSTDPIYPVTHGSVVVIQPRLKNLILCLRTVQF